MVSLAQVDAFAVEPCVPLVRKASSEFRPEYWLSNCQSSIAARSFTVKQRPEEKGDIFSINGSPQSSKAEPDGARQGGVGLHAPPETSWGRKEGKRGQTARGQGRAELFFTFFTFYS